MKTFTSQAAATEAAHPGQFVMWSRTMAVWAVMSFAERQVVNHPGGAWATVERVKPFHDVAAEASTGWHDDDVGEAA